MSLSCSYGGEGKGLGLALGIERKCYRLRFSYSLYWESQACGQTHSGLGFGSVNVPVLKPEEIIFLLFLSWKLFLNVSNSHLLQPPLISDRLQLLGAALAVTPSPGHTVFFPKAETEDSESVGPFLWCAPTMGDQTNSISFPSNTHSSALPFPPSTAFLYSSFTRHLPFCCLFGH